jgi:hypothetical protein
LLNLTTLFSEARRVIGDDAQMASARSIPN